MAAPVVRLRRSATQGAVPTTGQLALGEVAINTFDGKLFIKKDNGTESIVEIGAGGGGGISNVVEDTTPQLGGDLDLNGNDITGTGNATISTSAGVLSLTASGVGGKVNISGVAGNEIGSGTGTLQAGIFSGKEASAYTQNGSNLTVRGGNAFDAVGNTNTVQGGHLYLTGGVAGGGGEGVGVANGGSVYIDGGPLAGTGSNGKILIGTARTTFVGIGITNPNATLDILTPSGSSGNIINATRDGDAFSAFTLSRTGVAFRGNASGGNVSFVDYSGYQFYVGVDLQFQMGGHKFSLEDEGTYAWSSTTTAGQTADLTLYRDAANTLALRGGANGGNATSGQTLRVYNTYTNASNYERSYLGWDTNVFKIGVDNAGTGLARPINIVSNSTTDTLSPLQITQTWDASTSVVTGIALNITDTSSASTSNLLDLKVGGSSKFYINKSGFPFWPNVVTNTTDTFNTNQKLAVSGFYLHNRTGGWSQSFATQNSANWVVGGWLNSTSFVVRKDALFGWTNQGIGTAANSDVVDLSLFRDDANVLAQRNSTNAQTSRIYNTYTDASNYERSYLGWDTNVFKIGVDNAGTGLARPISIVSNATSDTLSPLQINQTWTAGTSVATGITLNITDTSSASNSKLLDLRVGGTSKFDIDKSGNVKNPYAYFGNNGNGELAINSINVINLYGGGTTGSLTKKIASMAHNGVFINNNLPLAFNSGILATGDLYLYRDNANVLAQRNGTNQNTFRIYNTWTNSTDNFERGQIGWSTNTLIVGTEKGGVGGTARPLHLQTDGTTRVAITTDGKVGIGLTEPTEELEVSGDIKATSFIKSGGTSSEYLMADGSVSSATTVEHKILDDISGSFNGSTTQFTITSSSTNFINSEITNAATLMISVGGVVQQPDPTQTNGYYISGGTDITTDPIKINFVEAPKAGQDFFGVAYGLATSPSAAFTTVEQSIAYSIVFGV